MNQKKILGSLVVVAAVTSAGAVALRPGSLLRSARHALHLPSETASTPIAPAGGEQAPRASAVYSRAGWQPGVEYRHDLDYKTSFGQRGADAAGTAPRLAFHLTARYRTRVAEVNGDATCVAVDLSGAKLETGASSAPPAEVVRALETPFFAEYDGNGRALALYVPPRLDATVLGVFRELVSGTQFTTPDTAAAEWSAVEGDLSGESLVSYRDVGRGRVFRQKRNYVRVAGPRGLVAAGKDAPTIGAYAGHLGVDDWGRIGALQITSQVLKSVLGSGLVFESESTLSLTFVDRARAVPGGASMQGFVRTMLMPEERDYRAAAEQSDQALVAGAGVDGILKELGDTSEGTSSVKARLAALLRLDPTALARVRARLDERNAPVVLGALAELGTAEAQKALGAVLADPHAAPGERKAAVAAVMSLEHPSRETGRALEPLLASSDPDLKNGASLALGIVSGHLGEEDPAAQSAMVHRIKQDFAGTTDTNERLRVINSLGNARSSESLPTLTEALASPDPAVRAAAAASLRFVPDPSADALLARVLTQDENLTVRGAALMAAGYRAYEPLAQALQFVAQSPDIGLRNELVAALANMTTRDSAAFVLLDWLAQSDPDANVRAQAQGALGRSAT